MTRQFDLNTFIRPHLTNLKPYTPILPFEVLSQQLGRQPHDIIKLDANENPYGPSPLVAQALAEAPYLHIYPDPESRELRAALAEYTGVAADYLLAGLGADELIDLVMRLFINPGDSLVNCPPTFGIYAFDASVNGARVMSVSRRADFSIDIEQVEALYAALPDQGQPPKLIFVTSPNNPDGSLLPDHDLKRLLALPAIIILDEAYIEFASVASRIQWVTRYPNLVVLRTFSKWAGLAGLRVGYGAFPPAMIEHLWKIKQPYNVPVTAQLAATISLVDRGRLLKQVAQLIAQRDSFYEALAQFTWLTAYPSQANFILCRVHGRSAAEIKQQLADQGILVRYYNSPGLMDCLRFSIGTPVQMARLVGALQQL